MNEILGFMKSYPDLEPQNMLSIITFFSSLGPQGWLPSEADSVQKKKIWPPVVSGIHISQRGEHVLLNTLTRNLEVDFCIVQT